MLQPRRIVDIVAIWAENRLDLLYINVESNSHIALYFIMGKILCQNSFLI